MGVFDRIRVRTALALVGSLEGKDASDRRAASGPRPASSTPATRPGLSQANTPCSGLKDLCDCIGGQLGSVAFQLNVQSDEALLHLRYFLRCVQPLPHRFGERCRCCCLLEKLGHHEVTAQNIGQPYPGLQALGAHDLPG